MNTTDFQWIRACDKQGIPDSADVVVWIDIARFDRVWSLDEPDMYLSPSKAPKLSKYVNFGRWLAQTSEAIMMPSVGAARGAWGFGDGRHRFSWFRDHGAICIPVTVYEGEADALREIAGVDL